MAIDSNLFNSGGIQINPSTTIDQVVGLVDALAALVQKVDGKGLSTNDLTDVLLEKLNGLSNYNDAALTASISSLQTQLNTLANGDVSSAIESFQEIVSFLNNITDSTTLEGIIAGINTAILAEKNRAIAAENLIQSNLSIAKDLTSKTTNASSLDSSTLSAGLLRTTTGLVQSSSGYSTSDFIELTANAKKIKVVGSGYPLLDGYCSMCIYDSNHNLVKAFIVNELEDLTLYPSAKYVRFSFTGVAAAHITEYIAEVFDSLQSMYDTLKQAIGGSIVKTVDKNGKGDFTTITDAIDSTVDGDTILVMPGTYVEHVELYGKLRHLVGLSRDLCIVTTLEGLRSHNPCNANLGSIENMTFIADIPTNYNTNQGIENSCYGIHIDTKYPSNFAGGTLSVVQNTESFVNITGSIALGEKISVSIGGGTYYASKLSLYNSNNVLIATCNNVNGGNVVTALVATLSDNIIKAVVSSSDAIASGSFSLYIYRSTHHEITIKNCKCLSKAHAGIGMGIRYNQTVKLIDCIFDTTVDGVGGLLFHNDDFYPNSDGAELVIKDCIMTGTTRAATITSMNNNALAIINFYNNTAFTKAGVTDIIKRSTPSENKFSGTDIALGVASHGNNISIFNS